MTPTTGSDMATPGGGDMASGGDAAAEGSAADMSAATDGGYVPPDMDPVLTQIAALAPTFTASIPGDSTPFDLTLGVEFLPTRQKWTHRGTVPHISGSSPKWIWAAAALAKNAPSALLKCATPTFTYSCNNTAGSLIDRGGGVAAVNDFTNRALGNSSDDMTLCNWSFDINRSVCTFPCTAMCCAPTSCTCGQNICNHAYDNATCDACGGNYFTADGALRFLEHVWNRDLYAGDPMQAAKTRALLDWSQLSPRNYYSGWIGTQLPPAIQKTLHHKPGAIAPFFCGTAAQCQQAGIADPAGFNWINEIAIIESPVGPYAVVTMMAHAQDWCQEIATTEWASCVIYHAMVRDVPDPFAAGVCTHDKAANPKSCVEVPEVCPPDTPGSPPPCM